MPSRSQEINNEDNNKTNINETTKPAINYRKRKILCASDDKINIEDSADNDSVNSQMQDDNPDNITLNTHQKKMKGPQENNGFFEEIQPQKSINTNKIPTPTDKTINEKNEKQDAIDEQYLNIVKNQLDNDKKNNSKKNQIVNDNNETKNTGKTLAVLFDSNQNEALKKLNKTTIHTTTSRYAISFQPRPFSFPNSNALKYDYFSAHINTNIKDQITQQKIANIIDDESDITYTITNYSRNINNKLNQEFQTKKPVISHLSGSSPNINAAIWQKTLIGNTELDRPRILMIPQQDIDSLLKSPFGINILKKDKNLIIMTWQAENKHGYEVIGFGAMRQAMVEAIKTYNASIKTPRNRHIMVDADFPNGVWINRAIKTDTENDSDQNKKNRTYRTETSAKAVVRTTGIKITPPYKNGELDLQKFNEQLGLSKIKGCDHLLLSPTKQKVLNKQNNVTYNNGRPPEQLIRNGNNVHYDSNQMTSREDRSTWLISNLSYLKTTIPPNHNNKTDNQSKDMSLASLNNDLTDDSSFPKYQKTVLQTENSRYSIPSINKMDIFQYSNEVKSENQNSYHHAKKEWLAFRYDKIKDLPVNLSDGFAHQSIHENFSPSTIGDMAKLAFAVHQNECERYNTDHKDKPITPYTEAYFGNLLFDTILYEEKLNIYQSAIKAPLNHDKIDAAITKIQNPKSIFLASEHTQDAHLYTSRHSFN